MANFGTPVPAFPNSAVLAALQILVDSISFETEAKQRVTLLNAQTLLRAIFKAAVCEVQYSAQERSAVARLLPRALLGIGAFISNTTTYFPPHGSLGWSKIERSGLQFLIDDFSAFDTSLTKAFRDFEAAEDLQGWDDRLKGASFFLPFDIHEFDMPEEQLRMIPQHHIWLTVPII